MGLRGEKTGHQCSGLHVQSQGAQPCYVRLLDYGLQRCTRGFLSAAREEGMGSRWARCQVQHLNSSTTHALTVVVYVCVSVIDPVAVPVPVPVAVHVASSRGPLAATVSLRTVLYLAQDTHRLCIWHRRICHEGYAPGRERGSAAGKVQKRTYATPVQYLCSTDAVPVQ